MMMLERLVSRGNNYANPSRFDLDLEIDLNPSPSFPE